MFLQDKKFLENKYHKTDEPFDPYQRMAYHGYDYAEETGLSDEEIQKGLLELYPKIKDLPHPAAKARAVGYVLEHTRIDVNEHDWFAGLYSVNRLAKSVTQDVWYQKLFDGRLSETRDKMQLLNDSWAVSIWPDFDHVVPDWESLLRFGFPGILARAKAYRDQHEKSGTLTEEKKAFFDGVILEYQSVIDLLDRLYRLACTQQHAKAKKTAACLKNLRDGAPQNIYEAMQLIYLYFIISESFDSYQVRSLGNGLDGSLYRFYQNDLKNRTYTHEEIRDLLAYFLFQWAAIGNYWGQPFYLGGTNRDGSTKYNELSRDILEVYDEIGIYNPKIQLKINRNTPDWLLRLVFSMVRKGRNSFVFCCEPGMMRAVMSYGASYEEARTMDIRGCYETGVRANEVAATTGYVNALKPVEYVFSNGFDRRIGKQVGRKTGELSCMTRFEDFYQAVLLQWTELIEETIRLSKNFEPYLGTINPSNLYSGTIEGSLKKGVDAYQCGVKFNNSDVLNCGFASLVDSVMAVWEFVYERQEITLSELGAALEQNWSGYEELRTKILKSPHKYGNGDEITDQYAKAMAAYFAMRVNLRKNARGGVYKAIMHSAMEFIWQGKRTGATPDGRFAGEEISKNASPAPGMDRNGVTALIKSALKLQPYIYPESFCLDVMLHPSAVSGEDGFTVLKALLLTYLDHDGMSIQFNVFDADTLRDAQKHPEKYQNLQVRVCGWNVLWNNLSRAEQNAYILRSENIQ